MRKVQIAIVSLLMFVGIMITGEFYVDYLYSFEDMTMADFCDNGNGTKNMLDELYSTAKENEVSICAISTEVKSTYSSEKLIYCDDELKKYLEDNYYVIEGKHRGLLSGSVTVKYDEFEKVPEDKINATVENVHFYLIGNNYNISDFMQKVSGKYGGELCNQGAASRVLQTERNLILIWGIIAFMIVVLSYYVVQIEKKESIIRMTLGEGSKTIFLKKALLEIIIICGLFEIIKGAMSFFQYTDIAIGIVRKIVYVTALLCAFIQMTVMFFDVSLVMSNAKISKEVICMNYLLKLIATVVTIILIVSELGEIGNYINYYKQKEFFEFYKGYSTVQIKVKDVRMTDPDEYEEKLYRDNVDKMGIVYFADDVKGTSDVNIISANKYAAAYIQNVISELKNYNFEEEIYIIYNKKTQLNDNILKEAKNIGLQQYDKDVKPDYKFIEYNKDVKFPFICLEEQYKSKISDNPIIVFNNLKESGEYNVGSGNKYQIFFKYAMWNATDSEISQALNKISPDKSVTANTVDVYQTYYDRLMIFKRVAFIKMGLIAVLLIVVMIISRMLVQITYSADSMEIAIKKTLGYGVFDRYKKMYILSGLINIMAVIFGTAYIKSKYYSGMEISMAIVCLIGIVIMLIDFMLITGFVLRQEKINVSKTLKGGCL